MIIIRNAAISFVRSGNIAKSQKRERMVKCALTVNRRVKLKTKQRDVKRCTYITIRPILQNSKMLVKIRKNKF